MEGGGGCGMSLSDAKFQGREEVSRQAGKGYYLFYGGGRGARRWHGQDVRELWAQQLGEMREHLVSTDLGVAGVLPSSLFFWTTTSDRD